MKKLLALIPLFILTLFACRQKTNEQKQEIVTPDTTSFFHVNQFIEGEIAEVNKTPYFIFKKTITNDRKDSTPINSAQFTNLAQPFLTANISQPPLKQHYKESIFFDETTRNYAISYTASKKDLQVQLVDVLLDEDAESVKRIFIRKFYNYPDSSVIEQLSWKTGQSFQINRLVQIAGDKEKSYQTNVVWGTASDSR